MAQRIHVPPLRRAAGALALLAALAAGATTPGGILVRYSFDEEALPTGPDTLAVFEHAQGRVHLTTEFRVSGYRAVEIRDVAHDGDFPELQGYFPLRRAGRLYVHFALLVAEPEETLNIALAGPEGFTVGKDGIALWLQTRRGWLAHVSDSIPKKLFPLRPFAWYWVDLAYDIEAGLYDLTVREEGQPQRLVALEAQPNASRQPGSAVDKFSFIGDVGDDTSSVAYYVDDVVLSVDEPLPLAPFVAPGRRRLFIDQWNELVRRAGSAPRCPPLIDLEDLGIGAQEREALERDGLLAPLGRAFGADRAPAPAPPGASATARRAYEGARHWLQGCAALGRGDARAALASLGKGSELLPEGRLFPLAELLALSHAGRHDEAAARLPFLESRWGGDPRFAVAGARLGIERGDLARAEEWLRQPAEEAALDFTHDTVRRLWSGRLDAGGMADLQRAFLHDWLTRVTDAIVCQQYFFVLLWKREYARAGEYAGRMAARLREVGVDPRSWLERAADAALLAGDARAARERYEESLGEKPSPWALLKLADAHFLLGDHEAERAQREKIYGSLHTELDH
jgi:tetratricopeptide (TPR) repeat protein